MFLCIGILSTLVALVAPYPNGGPSKSCGSLAPDHNGIRSRSAAGQSYTITTSSTTYSPGQKITVRVDKKSGASDLTGYMLQGRRQGTTEAVGVFTSVGQGKTRSCFGVSDNTVTHRDTTGYSSLTFTWQAPQTDRGSIEFIGTLSQSFGTFWTNVRSDPITFHVETPSSSNKPEVTTTTPKPETPSSGNTPEVTTTTKPPPTPAPPKKPVGNGSFSSEESEESNESSYENGSNSS